MGKTIIQQARGHGSFTYRVRRSAYIYRIGYPQLNTEGKFKVVSLLNSAGHTAPLAKIIVNGREFYIPASQGIYEGQEIIIGKDANFAPGNIAYLKNIPNETHIFNIEIRPGDGGKIARTSGNSATILRKGEKGVLILIGNKREVWINQDSRATIGIVAGQGRKTKPIIKAGKKWHMMKARNKLWPRTSAVKFNAVDHPFGCGRGKRIKSKIAKRDAPPGAKVGHLRPSRTGHIR
jgi:large subunit ribosomal protein L2